MNTNKITTACEKANHVCDKNQYKEATFWEKIKLTIHLAYCRACRNYSKNNAELTKSIKKSKLEVLDAATKEEIKACFNKELSNH